MGDRLNEAIKVIEAGDKEHGRHLLVAHLKENPQSEKGWLWLASVVEAERRQQALERVLEINPANERARQALEQMQAEEPRGPDLEMFASPRQPEVIREPSYEKSVQSDSTDVIALVIEVVFGFFGVLGVGWLYAGNLAVGLAALFGYWFLLAAEAFVGSITFGLFFCLVVPLNLVVLAFSGLKARDFVRNTGARGHIIYPVVALVLPIIFVCGSIFLLSAMGPTIDSIFNEIVRDLEAVP